MKQYDFGDLFDQYLHIIDSMKPEFSSHEFILLLAKQNQKAYINALHAYSNRRDPFRVVHGLLSKQLHIYKTVIKHMGNQKSDNIFGQPGDCAYWRKINYGILSSQERSLQRYPSPALLEWCRKVNLLVKALHPNFNDGFCECNVLSAVLSAPDKDSQAQIACGLFWSIWIDQVMYYVLVDKCPAAVHHDEQLYFDFRSIYPFPKIYSHGGRGHASPWWFLMERENYAIPKHDLLLDDKKEFWGEIESWLLFLGKNDLRDALIEAFKEDIALRFPANYEFLWQA